jgi:hypothetical protein
MKWHGIQAYLSRKQKNMKRYVLIVCLLVVGISAFSKHKHRNKSKSHSTVHVISKKRDTFYFRVEQPMIGGEIHVVNQLGDTIATAPIMRKHALVDFYYEEPGRYSIVVSKGNTSQTFDFEKTSPSPYVLIEREKMTIYQ